MESITIDYLNNIERTAVFAVAQAILDSNCDGAIVMDVFAEKIGNGGVFRSANFERFQGFRGSAIFHVRGDEYILFKF